MGRFDREWHEIRMEFKEFLQTKQHGLYVRIKRFRILPVPTYALWNIYKEKLDRFETLTRISFRVSITHQMLNLGRECWFLYSVLRTPVTLSTIGTIAAAKCGQYCIASSKINNLDTLLNT